MENTTRKSDTCTCDRAASPGEKTWCCLQAERDALRAVIDVAIRDLGSEITAPNVIDDGQAARQVIAITRSRLASVRNRAA